MKDTEQAIEQQEQLPRSAGTTRRQFLTTGLLLAGGALLTACRSTSQEAKPTAGVATLQPVGAKPEAAALATATAAPKPTIGPTVITKPESSPSSSGIAGIFGNGEVVKPELMTVNIGNNELKFYGQSVVSAYDGYFVMDDAYQQVGDKVCGPISRMSLSLSGSRLDAMSIAPALPEDHKFNPVPFDDKLRTRDGSKKDFIGKFIAAQHNGNEISFHEYAIGAESWTGERSNDTPIHQDYSSYAVMKDVWKIEGQGSERFAQSMGQRRFGLVNGNAPAGTLAMIFMKYKFSAQ